MIKRSWGEADGGVAAIRIFLLHGFQNHAS